jgi:hypothetical protein
MAKGLHRRPGNRSKGVTERERRALHRQEAIMSPSRWHFGRFAVPLFAAAILMAASSPGLASINWAGTLLMPATVVSKSCSGAFRYAARDGNDDIAPLSPVQAFADDRRFNRTRYAARAMAGLEPERSRVLAYNTMCGAR